MNGLDKLTALEMIQDKEPLVTVGRSNGSYFVRNLVDGSSEGNYTDKHKAQYAAYLIEKEMRQELTDYCCDRESADEIMEGFIV